VGRDYSIGANPQPQKACGKGLAIYLTNNFTTIQLCMGSGNDLKVIGYAKSFDGGTGRQRRRA